jgi:hypothetical protein
MSRLNIIDDLVEVLYDISCVFCGADEESVDHLFVSCVYIFSIWYHIFRWLGIEFVSPNNIGHVF